MEELAGECPGCGKPLDETTREGRPHDHYEADFYTCLACAVKQEKEDARRERTKGHADYGVLTVIREKPQGR